MMAELVILPGLLLLSDAVGVVVDVEEVVEEYEEKAKGD